MTRKKAAPCKRLPFQDPKLDTDSRVRDLIERMTLEEKIRQMGCAQASKCVVGGRVSKKAIKERLGGMSIGTVVDARTFPRTSAETINAIQKYLIEETRLGIPALVHCECLHGHMSKGATVFPQSIGLAGTWNTRLIGRMAAARIKLSAATPRTSA